MITLNLLKFIENNNLGEIDKDLFWQKMTLGEIGVYISSIGNPTVRGNRTMTSFEMYSRGTNDVDGYKRLKDIVDLLNASYSVCKLPSVSITEGNQTISVDAVENITIMPCSTITNGGLDDNNRIIWTATGTIYH
jgi:hypothetical protein